MVCHFCDEPALFHMVWLGLETADGVVVTEVGVCLDHEHFVRNTMNSIDALPSMQREDG